MRVALVSDTAIGEGPAFPNGFSNRYALIARRLLNSGHTVLLVPDVVQRGPVSHDDSIASSGELTEITLGRDSYSWPKNRALGRLKSVAVKWSLPGGSTGWERTAGEVVAAWKPDVLLALAPWAPKLVAMAPAGVPIGLFAEEDLSPMFNVGRGELRWRSAFQRVSRPTRSPDVVVTINERERAWAHSTYPHSRVMTVPHAIDLDHWNPGGAEAAPDAPTVLCAGDFSQRRNHEGLAGVANCLRAAGDANVEIGIASVHRPPEGLHQPPLRHLGAVDDLRPYYRGCTAALVPAFVVTGVKTQIIQAWAMGAPVVTTHQSAASAAAVHREDLLSGGSPAEVASLLSLLVRSPQLGAELASRGLERVRREHSEVAIDAALGDLLDALLERAR